MPNQSSDKPTFVTLPSIAPIEEYVDILKPAWESGILTHNGPILRRLERELEAYWNTQNLVVMTNGTVAIQLAIKALGLTGEVITTPFTWVATASSIIWERCTPVFVDVDPDTFNIDPAKIEDAISHKTSAILPVHVFSNPCDVEAIDVIAKNYNLKVIYDAAHATSVNYMGKSVMEYGDISAMSFHATKLFNSGEGGACIATDEALFKRLRRLRFFGYDTDKSIVDEGCNGKMTELHAALGVANLKYMPAVELKRKQIYETYYGMLKSLGWITFQQFDPKSYNYSYMPIIFDTEIRLLSIMEKLNAANIYPRRYFYPSLNKVSRLAPYSDMPISESLASRIICLPSYTTLTMNQISRICNIISHA